MARTNFEGLMWTSEMDAVLGTVTDMEAAEMLGMSYQTIAKRRRVLGIERFRSTPSSNKDFQQQVAQLAVSHSAGEIALIMKVPKRWVVSAAKVQQGPQQARFARKKYERFSLSDATQWADERGGKCLSPLYSSSQLRWRCSNGHEWENTFASIRRGHWCNQCATPKLTVERLTTYAANHRGKFVEAIRPTGKEPLSECVLVFECKDTAGKREAEAYAKVLGVHTAQAYVEAVKEPLRVCGRLR